VAQNRFGRKIKLAGTGVLSRAVQHEIDHLDGKLYIDYLDSMEELISVGLGDDADDDSAVREAKHALA
jgi:peptide deformylase